MITPLPPLSSFRAVLFDLDNTLLDHDHAAHVGVIEWSNRLGVPPDPARWAEVERRHFLAFERGELSHDQQRYMRIREYLGRPGLTDAEAAELFSDYISCYQAALIPIPHAAQTLAKALSLVDAHNATVGILTNGAAALQTRKMQMAGLWDERLVMLAAKELGSAKPNRECYVRALAAIDVAPQDAIVIGDDLTNDVLGPRSAGLAAIYFARDGEGAAAAPPGVPVVSRLTELLW